MREFLDENFLLSNNTGVKLYHEYVANLPIIDYHNHLSPQDIAADKTFSNITDLWLAEDHYKWRAMRANGIPEHLISGNATPWEKFEAWANTVPNTLRNPLYHWTHLELQRYFGIKTLLGPETAKQIYDQCNEMLQAPDFSARALLKKMRVEKLCTTDHPNDELLSHKQLATQNEVSVRPTFRPDQFLSIQCQDDFVEQVARLGSLTGISIDTFDQLVMALEMRIDYFNDLGCVTADHGLSELDFIKASSTELDRILDKAVAGQVLSKQEIGAFQSSLLMALSENYKKFGWVQQYHLGPLRNNNSLLMKRIGADAGADSIGDHRWANPISSLLDAMNSNGHLGKTILYNLNPADNALFATMAGNFNSEETPGKVQYGAAWWFLDQKNGIEQNLNDISNFGLLHHFVGMLTDSRSFLSFPRHEYFRRILCNTIGEEVEEGLLPSDESLLKTLVSNVAYNNAKNYFKWA